MLLKCFLNNYKPSLLPLLRQIVLRKRETEIDPFKGPSMCLVSYEGLNLKCTALASVLNTWAHSCLQSCGRLKRWSMAAGIRSLGVGPPSQVLPSSGCDWSWCKQAAATHSRRMPLFPSCLPHQDGLNFLQNWVVMSCSSLDLLLKCVLSLIQCAQQLHNSLHSPQLMGKVML